MSRSRRQAGHTGANAVTLGYLVAAAAELAVDGSSGPPTWLVVHLLLLGAATNAIVTWSAHFASALLQQPPLPAAVTLARLVVLNVGVVGVLVGVSTGRRGPTIAAAAIVAAVVAVHVGALVRTVQAGRSRRFAGSMRFYWVAGAAAVAGIGLGVTLAFGEVSPLWYERIYLAHVHLGLLGWVTLTVLGTEFTLWPIALRTRMVPGAERAAAWSLAAGTAGLSLAVAGLLAWVRALAAAGVLVYLAGVLAFLVPFLRTGRQRTPRSAGPVMLAASTAWLLAGLVADAVALAGAGDPFALAGDVSGLIPWVSAGFVVQVLLGALTYLVPVLLSGPPALGRRRGALLERWWVARVAALNAGAVLVALPGREAERAGWLLVGVAIVAFAALAVAAALTRTDARTRTDEVAGGRRVRS